MEAVGLCSIVLAVLAAQAGTQASSETARPLLARVNGEEVGLDGFRDWLVRVHGWRHVDDFVDLVLLRQEARRLEVARPTAEEIEAAFVADWNDQMLLLKRGDEAAFTKELADAGMDRQSYRDRRLGTLELEILAKRILQLRPMSDVQVQELHELEFGKDAVRTHVRVAFFDKLKSVRPGQRVSKALAEKLDAEAGASADAFLKTVAADRSRFAALVGETDFVTIQRFDSYHVDLRTQGGEIARLHHDHFGGALEAALKDAKTGELVGPVATPAGFYVVDLVERAPAPFQSVVDELKEIWRTRAPSPGEIESLKRELRKAAKVERLPLAE